MSRFILILSVLLFGPARAAETAAPSREQVLAMLKRASAFMIEKAGNGRAAYVWSYLPDLSRRWGEMEATPTMLWVQPPGAPAMGDLFLDAYHVTGDEFYYRAAAQVADALIAVQHPRGGWNYVADLAGEESLRKWYATVGANGWRLEEFQHYYGNATFDDETTISAARFMLRMALDKNEPRFRAALDRAIAFVLDSQQSCGGWPQRFPPAGEFVKDGRPDYTGFTTLNDDVTDANIDFLLQCYGALGDARLLAAARRGMDAFLVLQQPAPQAGWALQYTAELKPAGARTYEPAAVVTHTTAACIGHLIEYYELTGERKFLARIPEALAWLDKVQLPPNTPGARGTHPTFLEVGTDQPLYVHRTGSNVVSGHYFVDRHSENTIAHYSSFRSPDVAGLRARYEAALAKSPEEVMKTSPLRVGAPRTVPPRLVSRVGGFFGGRPAGRGLPIPPGTRPMRPAAARSGDSTLQNRVAQLVASLNAAGYWAVPLRSTSHPYKGTPRKDPAPGDFSRTQVGDDYDTSPYAAKERVMGISTASYIGNMAALLRYLDTRD